MVRVRAGKVVVLRILSSAIRPIAPSNVTPQARLVCVRNSIGIIGGGIAGLGTAWSLARRGFTSVEVFEADAQPFSAASGLNAGIYRPLEEDPTLTRLALKNAALMRELAQAAGTRSLVRETGLVLLPGVGWRLARLMESARLNQVGVELVGDVRRKWPHVFVEQEGSILGVYCRLGGVIDVHAVSMALVSELRRAGVKLHYKCTVRPRYCARGGSLRVLGVEGDEMKEFDKVVVAAGARTRFCAPPEGPHLPLLPLQRHLAFLSEQPLAIADPVFWRFDPETYVRYESGGTLTSPCDERPCPSTYPQSDLLALSGLEEQLLGFNRALGQASVRRYWACVRMTTVDRRPVLGADSRVQGLHWLVGLGGHGMSIGLACADLVADAMSGRPPPVTLSAGRSMHRR